VSTPFSSTNYPTQPATPSGPPLGYVAPHKPPNPSTSAPPLTPEQAQAQRDKWHENNLRQVLLTAQGSYVPGESSFSQLQQYNTGIVTGFTDIYPAALANNDGTASATIRATGLFFVNNDGTVTFTTDGSAQLAIMNDGTVQIPSNALDAANHGVQPAPNRSVQDMVNGLSGVSLSDPSYSMASTALNNVRKAISGLSTSVNALQTTADGNVNSGQNYQIDFSKYPDGPIPPVFSLNYSGAGASSIGILSGRAHWTAAKDGLPRTCVGIFNAGTTSTDYQILGGVSASLLGV
jgi:hypothetical protein